MAPDPEASRRTIDERVLVRFPALIPIVVRLVQSLPLHSRLRRSLIARGLRRGYAATSRGDYSLASLALSPDFEIHLSESARLPPDLVGVHRGREGWRHVVGEVIDVWEFAWVPEEVLDCGGGRSVVTLRLDSRGRSSGIPMSRRVFEALTWRDGLLVRQEVFGDQAQALEAVGLRE